MKNRSLALSLLLFFGCSEGPTRPDEIHNSRLVPTNYELTFQKAMRVIASEGYPIQSSDKASGIITTGRKTMRLTESQADCGNVLGLDYIKDSRTSTSVAHSIVLVAQGNQTEVTVNTQIEGLFNASAGSGTKTLACETMGGLETGILRKMSAR